MSDISFTAKVNYDKQKYICDVELYEDSLNLIVNEPTEIKGLTLKNDKNGTKAEFMGVSFDVDTRSLPYGALVEVLLTTINDASNKTIDFDDSNGEIRGSVEGSNYLFEFAPSGLPLTLKIDDMNLYIEFSNVTIK